MTLPSQRSGPGGRGPMVNFRRRRGPSPRSFVVVALVVGAVALGGFLWLGPDDAKSAPEGEGGAGTQGAGTTRAAGGGDLSTNYVPRDLTKRTSAGVLGGALEDQRRSSAQKPTTTRTTSPSPTPVREERPDTGRKAGEDEPAEPDPRLTQPADDAAAKPAPVVDRPTGSASARAAVAAAEEAIAKGEPVAAREGLLASLRRVGEGPDASVIRERLGRLNRDLLLTKKITPGDPWVEAYKIKPNDSLSRIASRQSLAVDWRLIQRVNGMADPNKIRLNDTIKLVHGPFNAVVDKSEYRLDIFRGSPTERDAWDYVFSFTVGLGEGDSTPTGRFVVKRDSKLIDPYWINPRTREHFDSSDPKNPIGEHWVGLEGLGADVTKTGYGIHGTIDPDSIGEQRSMGCVRMREDDVALVYELLVEGVSVVEIRD